MVWGSTFYPVHRLQYQNQPADWRQPVCLAPCCACTVAGCQHVIMYTTHRQSCMRQSQCAAYLRCCIGGQLPVMSWWFCMPPWLGHSVSQPCVSGWGGLATMQLRPSTLVTTVGSAWAIAAVSDHGDAWPLLVLLLVAILGHGVCPRMLVGMPVARHVDTWTAALLHKLWSIGIHHSMQASICTSIRSSQCGGDQACLPTLAVQHGHAAVHRCAVVAASYSSMSVMCGRSLVSVICVRKCIPQTAAHDGQGARCVRQP